MSDLQQKTEQAQNQEQTQQTSNQQPHNVINVINERPKTNGVGTAGFVLALVGLFVSCIPILGWIIWALGAILSFVGIFKTPRGLSIAGLCISFIGLILLILFLTVISLF